MAMKMDRRAFLKTSAAVAMAVSMTGLLGGCSGGDDGTDLGGYTAAVNSWATDPHEGSLSDVTPWWAEFKMNVRVRSLYDKETNLPGRFMFKLTIDGKEQEMMKGDGATDTLFAKNSWLVPFSKGGEYRQGNVIFKMTDKDLYESIRNGKVDVVFTVGTDRTESYKLDYTDKTFVKQTV